MIFFFKDAESAIVEFSIWLNKHKGSWDRKLPSTEIPFSTTRIYCAVHSALWEMGCQKLPINFQLLDFPVSVAHEKQVGKELELKS